MGIARLGRIEKLFKSDKNYKSLINKKFKFFYCFDYFSINFDIPIMNEYSIFVGKTA